MKKILLFVSFSIVASLLFLEIALRIYFAVSNTRTTLRWQDDNMVGRRLVSSQKGWFVSPTGEYKTLIETNKDGWRDTEHSLQKENDVFRILFIGDSFVENFQVDLDQTFFKQIEKNLQQSQQDKKFEVIAMGLGDTGTAQQFLVLKNYGLSYKPDLVVHLFFSGNDVKNNSAGLQGDPYRPYFVLENDQLKELAFTTRSSITKYKLLTAIKSNSRLIELILDAKGKLLAQKPDDYPIDYQIYLQNPSSEFATSWDVTKKLISESKKISEENGSKYMLISSANNEQVNSKLLQKLHEIYPAMSQANLDMEKPDKILNEFCEKEQFNCHFLLPYFKEFQQQNPNVLTHFLKDGHWTKEGSDLVAKTLTKILTDYLIIK